MLAALACWVLLARVVDVGLRPHPFALQAPPPPADVDERDAEIVVAVTGADDAAVRGAEARVYWERDERFYLAGTGRSGDDGRIEISGLPRGAVWVVVEAAHHARASTRLVLEGGERYAALKLERAAALRVTVSDEEGAPLPRATVLVNSGDPLPFGALTSNVGVASFTSLPRSPWTVKASAPGYESVTQSGVTADVTLALRRLASLDVHVKNADGSAASGAQVAITGSTLWPARRAETNANGTASIAGLVAGHFDLRATKGDQVSETMFGFEVQRGAHETLTLKLGPGRMVVVSVTDDEPDRPSPVGNADVVLAEGGLSSFPIQGRTAGDGSVTLGPISAGAATVSASADGFVTRPAVVVPEVLDGPVKIQLMRGGTLDGEVVDSKGAAVDGATVEIIGIDLFGLPIADSPSTMAFRRSHFEWALAGPRPLIPAGELGVMPGPIPPIPRGTGQPVDTVDSAPLAFEPWVTRLDGKFEAHPVTPGRVRALVRHPAYVEGFSDPVNVQPGGRAKVKIVLLAGGAIEGRVVDASGRGVSGARVDLTAARGTLERTTLTATDGSFAFASVPEEVIVSVARPEDPSKLVVRKTIEVPEGGRTNLTVELPAPRDAFTVSVVDESGRAVDAAQVAVLSLDPSAPLRQTVFTSSDGKATIADARGLELRVVVEAPGFGVAVRQVAKAGDKIEIALSRGVLVEGSVTSVRGRRTVEGASVTLVSEGRRFAALTNKDGIYRIKDVAAAPVHIIVAHPDFANAEATATVTATGRADRAFELPTIDLSEGGGVEGVVTDAQGKAVQGARVGAGVVPAYLPAGTLPTGMAVTDAKGRFKLSGIAPGKAEIEAYAPDVGRGVAHVVIQSGRNVTGITLRLTHAAGDDDPTVSGSVAVTLGERGDGDDLEVVVVHVADASEAERAGLAVGDVVLSVDGRDVVDMRDARARLSGPTRTDVVIEVERASGTVKLRVGREQVRR